MQKAVLYLSQVSMRFVEVNQLIPQCFVRIARRLFEESSISVQDFFILNVY